MTPEQLKASILQYAIQGKLVEQRPEEGTGEELYQQIQEDKQRLIKRKNHCLLSKMMKFLLIFEIVGSGLGGVNCRFRYNMGTMLQLKKAGR